MSALKDELMSDEPYRYEHDQVMGDYVFRKGNRVLFRATSLAVATRKTLTCSAYPANPSTPCLSTVIPNTSWNTHANFKLHTEKLAYQEWHQK